jgi:uncharacterized repeat protein (TIGR01451 family)
MMRFFFVSCLLFVFLVGAFGQEPTVVDTIQMNWDTLQYPTRGPNATQYLQYKDTLFCSAINGDFLQSSDYGKTWVKKVNKRIGSVITKDAMFILSVGGERNIGAYSSCANVYSRSIVISRSVDGGSTYIPVYGSSVEYLCGIPTCGARGCYDPTIILNQGSDDSTLIFTHSPLSGTDYINYISTDLGNTWKSISSYSGNKYSKVISGNYVKYTNNKFFYTKNNDIIFKDSIDLNHDNLQYNFTWDKILLKDSLFAIINIDYSSYDRPSNIFYSTTNNGRTWKIDTLPFGVLRFIQYNDSILIFTNKGIFKTTDFSLKNIKKIYPNNDSIGTDISGFSQLPSGWYINNYKGELLRSKDLGESWQMVNNTEGVLKIENFYTFNDTLWLKGENKFCFKTKDFKNIEGFNNNQNIVGESYSTFQRQNAVFIRGYSWFMRSTDDGNSWQHPLSNFGDISNVKYDSSRIYAFNREVFAISNDNGKTFLPKYISRKYRIKDLLFKGNTLFCVTSHLDSAYNFQNITFLKSTDNGDSWEELSFPQLGDGAEVKLFNSGMKIIALSYCGIYESIDEGKSWLKVDNYSNTSNECYFDILQYKKHNIFVDYSKKRFKITGDNGVSWVYLINNFANYDTKYFIGENFLYTLYNNRVLRLNLDSLTKRVAPLQDYAVLSGQIFKDKNDNCKKDTLELGLSEKIIKIQPRNYVAIADKNGKFSVALPPDTYTISTSNIQYHKATCGDTILKNITLKANEKKDTQIVFKQTEKAYDLALSLTTGSRARPGFEMEFVLKTQNFGTENIDSALVTLDMPNNNLEFINADQNGVFKNNQVSWVLKNQATDATKTVSTRVRLSPNTPLSIPLVFKAKSTIFNQKDTFPLNNVDSVRLNVTGSFDPNDKTVLPEGKIPFFTNELDYLIRFQNTGNDTAFKVVVVDTLPPQLDVVSLKTISASHPYVVSLKKNIITFTFDNILLPDSNVNERASHGFIRFKLKPQNGLKVGDNINNKAAIYFDYNKPIITNTAQLELIKPMIIVSQNKTLCKGDSYKNKPYFDNTIVYDTVKSLLYDTTFMTSIDIKPTYQVSKDTILKANEKLFNKNVENGEIVILKLKTVLGCDSSITYKVSKLSTETQELPEGFASIKIYPNPVKDYLSISYELNKMTFVEISLFNTIGQKVKILQEKIQNTEGVYRLNFDVKDLQEGWYQLTIETEKGVFGQRFIKIK